MTTYDLTTHADSAYDTTVRQHVADTDAVLFTVHDVTDDLTDTYALVRAPFDLHTESDTNATAGSLVVYYADSATTAYFDITDFADFIPDAAYTLI